MLPYRKYLKFKQMKNSINGITEFYSVYISLDYSDTLFCDKSFGIFIVRNQIFTIINILLRKEVSV
ncbi:hypothetical protein EEL33_09350 [Muribaculaceae bacterium Isolate-037 (Harlan)]|nr:hypothetical protein EEL33_09350 [Muribaculaceae bacterium Isolate-037 (Harlan)]